MPSLSGLGRVLFGVCLVALGIENVVVARVPATVSPTLPVLPWLPPHAFLAYLVGGLLIGGGLAVVARRGVRLVAFLLSCFFGLCALTMQLPRSVAVPLDLSVRTALLEVLAFCGAAMVLAVLSSSGRVSGLDRLLELGHYLFAVTLFGFGLAHFLVPHFIATLIPSWIPFRLFWAYFTGAAFVATGLAIFAGRFDGVAATLLGVMFLLWFFSLHVPRILSAERGHNPNEWSSAFIALGMCGASWIVASDAWQRYRRP